MRRAALLALVGLALGACRSASPTLSEGTRAAVRDTVMAIVNAIFSAGDQRNAAAQVPFYTTGADVRILDNGTVYTSPAGYFAMYDTLFQAIGSLRMTLHDVQPTVLSSEAAVAVVPFTFVITSKTGKAVNGQGAWTGVFQKRPEGWRVTQSHESEVDINNVLAQVLPPAPAPARAH
jgi:ketosteroid isomerase-like protein